MQERARELSDDAPHILVVDDDRRLRALLAKFLTENGFRITAAADAAEARSMCDHFVFDALVLDVMMPGENGFDFARWLRHPLAGADPDADGPRRFAGSCDGARNRGG